MKRAMIGAISVRALAAATNSPPALAKGDREVHGPPAFRLPPSPGTDFKLTQVDHTVRVLSRPEFIALVAALMGLNALAIDVMLPALPYMGEALGVSEENERQFVIGAYMMGFGIAQLAFGPLTDRFGRRGPLLAGLAIYLVCAFAATFAPNFAALLALRFAQGLGAAGTRVIATAVVRDRFSGRAMAEVMALTFMVFMAIPIVAPGIGQVLLLVGPWETIFIFMGALAAAIAVWAYLRLPETLAPEKRRPLRLGSIAEGFRLVFTNRVAISYGLAGMFLLSAGRSTDFSEADHTALRAVTAAGVAALEAEVASAPVRFASDVVADPELDKALAREDDAVPVGERTLAQILSELAEILSDAKVRENLLTGADPNAIFRTLSDWEPFRPAA